MQESQQKPSRRGFFFGAVATSVAAAAVVALPGTQLLDTDQQTISPLKPAPENGGGYSLSEHVKHYYRTARL